MPQSAFPIRWLAVPLLTVLMGTAVAPAADWPQWRGPDRNDTTTDSSGWPTGWPPVELWKANVGRGCTSPVVVGDRLYVMGWQGDRRGTGADTVYCLNYSSGKEIWKQAYPSPYQGRRRTGDQGEYGGPSSTPTFDPQTQCLFTLGIDGDLACWDAAHDGKPLWRKNLYDEYKVRQRPDVGGGIRDYGFTSSPLMVGDTVVVEAGAPAPTIVAFDKKTGLERWRSELSDPAGHTGGPVPLKIQGLDCLATLSVRRLVVMRTDANHAGETLAEYPWPTDFACNLATPAVLGNQVVLTSAYNRQKSALVEISLTGARLKWESAAHAMVASPVVRTDRVYLVYGTVKCLDLANGRILWQGGNFGHGSAIATADRKLVVFGNGTLSLLDLAGDNDRYRELSSLKRVVPDVCYPHVVLAGNLLFCKDRAGSVVCLSLAAKRAD